MTFFSDATDGMTLLCGTAASIGFLHALLGPDHYLPFVAMSRAGGWSLSKTVVITLLCGIGHVLSSVVLGLVGIGFGVGVLTLEAIEGLRGDLSGWLLLAFGLTYFVYGVHRAIRNKPHTHWHVHADGTAHSHKHVHTKEHVHVHEGGAPCLSRRVGMGMESARPFVSPTAKAMGHPDPSVRHGGASLGHATHQTSGDRATRRSERSITPWVLFTIFLFGPCEPLIPILMYPAAQGNMWAVALVTAIFGITTLATMTVIVIVACVGIGSMRFTGLERYTHALAGFVVLVCGAAIKTGL